MTMRVSCRTIFQLPVRAPSMIMMSVLKLLDFPELVELVELECRDAALHVHAEW